MQSESDDPATRSSISAYGESPLARQHGSPSTEPLPDSSSYGPVLASRPQDAEASDPTTSIQTELRRLSLSERPALFRPSVSRIAEYENASAPVPPAVEPGGPGFKVIKRKGQRLGGPHLDQFPNEVLTHILSHLPPASLAAASLVCQRFYSLVTTPHAWRTAFSRYFPGQDALEETTLRDNRRGSDHLAREALRTEQRFFTRLTALASWRSEYILRTRLLRSLSRGKPAQIAPGRGASSRSNSAANNANAVVTYNSQLFATINHIHASWNGGNKSPRFVHGTGEMGAACASDPNIGKVDNWGLTDPAVLPQFTDLNPGGEQWGLGSGDVVAVPNTMDVSQPFGMVYGEGFPGGLTYFRSSDEMRGRFLAGPGSFSVYKAGVPNLSRLNECICSVWIAKSPSIPNMTEGLVGILSGSSSGVVTAYSLGADNLRDNRLGRGEISARWMLSPGVPIIALAVDDSYNPSRRSAARVWAVALNALGEVFHLTGIPRRTSLERGTKGDDEGLSRTAWETGRTVYWNFCEPTRRAAQDDPYHENECDGSYSPRSSCYSMNLSEDQIVAETREIEKFAAHLPKHFQKICAGWDMRRRLEVDFAADDGHGAGEGIVVINCGYEDTSAPGIMRYTRLKVEQASLEQYPVPRTPPLKPQSMNMASLFGGGPSRVAVKQTVRSPRESLTPDRHDQTTRVEEWRTSLLVIPDAFAHITTSALDMSTFATVALVEDPLITVNGRSTSTSPLASPDCAVSATTSTPHEVPGHRARHLAVGTKTGAVYLWDIRQPYASNTVITNELRTLRIIQTDSPQITCLAVSALYLVHGGNDGLVQTWDPLASTLQPLRTLNSRFSSRARRRLVQAEASVQGVGINLYAAGAITIDPDPTILRGMVSLGTHLRYWSYSSNAADQISSKKRRLRRSGERGHNGGTDRFTNTGRGALMDYIATEQDELKKDRERREREESRLRGRFGVGLGGLSDEEAIRYAELISQEAYESEQRRFSDAAQSEDSSSAQSEWSSRTVTPEGSVVASMSSPQVQVKSNDEFDRELEEAIRLSLLDGYDEAGQSPRASGSALYNIPVRYKQKSQRSPSSSPLISQAASSGRWDDGAVDDLDFAMQVSLAEERSAAEARKLSISPGTPDVKGKGKSKKSME